LIAWLTTGTRLGPAIDPALRLLPHIHFLIGHLLYGIGVAVVLWIWAGRKLPEIEIKREPRPNGGLGIPIP
jgi:hypothetical protein